MSKFKVDKANVVKGLNKELDDFVDIVVIGVYRDRNKVSYLASSCDTEETKTIINEAYGEWL